MRWRPCCVSCFPRTERQRQKATFGGIEAGERQSSFRRQVEDTADVPSEDRAWMARRVVAAGLAHAVEAVGSERAPAAGRAQGCNTGMAGGDVVRALPLALGGAWPVLRADTAVGSLEDTRASRIGRTPWTVHEPAPDPCVSAGCEPPLPARCPLQPFSVCIECEM